MAREATVTVAYVPFKTFTTALDTLRQGIPDPIDKSVFKNQSFSTQNMLISSLKALGAIDDTGRPQPILKRLVEPSTRKDALKEVIEDKYRGVLGLGLAATDNQIDNKFREYGVGGETLNKAKSFFLQAAGIVGIPLSPHIRGARTVPNGDGEGATVKPAGSTRRRRVKKPPAGGASGAGGAPSQDASLGTLAAIWHLPNGVVARFYVSGDTFKLPKADRDNLFKVTDEINEFDADGPGEPEPPASDGAAES